MRSVLTLCGLGFVLSLAAVFLIGPLNGWALAFTFAGVACCLAALILAVVDGMKTTRHAMFDTPDDEEEWERDHDGDW